LGRSGCFCYDLTDDSESTSAEHGDEREGQPSPEQGQDFVLLVPEIEQRMTYDLAIG